MNTHEYLSHVKRWLNAKTSSSNVSDENKIQFSEEKNKKLSETISREAFCFIA
jgi:hypothetical protein